MPATDSVNLLKNIFSVHPQAKVLILSMSSEEIYAKKYLQLGALGFINKESDSTEIRRAITTVMSNRKYVSPKLEEIINRQEIEGPPAKSVFEKLSARELEVMTHLIEGRNISEIAGLLSVHISTASTHKANIMEKLKVKNVIELTTLVKRFNIV